MHLSNYYNFWQGICTFPLDKCFRSRNKYILKALMSIYNVSYYLKFLLYNMIISVFFFFLLVAKLQILLILWWLWITVIIERNAAEVGEHNTFFPLSSNFRDSEFHRARSKDGWSRDQGSGGHPTVREESIYQCRTGLTGGSLEGPYLPKSL